MSIGREVLGGSPSLPLAELTTRSDVQESIDSSPVDGSLGNGSRRKSLPFILSLSAGFLGLQGVFTVLFGSGTAYLSSLDFSHWVISLSWLAGPLAGLLFQPYVGALSDGYSSRWGKRRPFIVAGTAVTIITLIAISYAEEFAAVVLARFPGERGYKTQFGDRNSYLGMAVFVEICLWLLNFAIQPIQMGLRSLLVDSIPSEQQSDANAWAARFALIGNIMGYGLSASNLAEHLPFIGKTQFQILCFVIAANLLLCVSITCYTVSERISERPNPKFTKNGPSPGLKGVLKCFTHLPRNIRKVCLIQIFAWFGWFPFLFYASSYVSHVYRKSHPEMSPWEESTRVGSHAMVIFAFSSLTMAVVLPLLSRLGSKHEMSGFSRLYWLRETNKSWFSLRRIWFACHTLFSVAMFMTFFTADYLMFAYIIIATAGISWAATTWIPFTLISREIRQTKCVGSYSELTEEGESDIAATVIGIHNMAMAAPQVFSASVCGLFFWVSGKGDADLDDALIIWPLRAGGLSTLVAAWITASLPE